MNSRIIAALILVVWLLPSGCSRRTSNQPENTKIRIRNASYLAFAPLFIAREEGYFEELGLDVDFVELQRSQAGIPALVEGDLDVLFGALNAGILNAVARGAKIKIVADFGTIGTVGPPTTALLIRKELAEQGALHDGSALRGKVLETNRDNTAAFFVEKALGEIGLIMEDMIVKQLPSASLPDAAAKGTLDIIQATEPWVTRLLDAGDVELWRADYEVIPNFQYSYVAFGPALLEDDRDAGRRFIIAFLKGVRQYAEGKTARNIDILSRYTNLTPEFLQRAGWPVFHVDGRINVDSIMEFQTWAAQKDLVDRALAASEFWEPFFVDQAGQLLSGDR